MPATALADPALQPKPIPSALQPGAYTPPPGTGTAGPATGPAPTAPAAQPPAPAPGPAPTAPYDSNAALNQLQTAAQGRLGRALTQEELTALYAQPGVNYTGGSTGAPVTAAQLQAALGIIGKYSGNLSNPWGPLQGAPAAPAAPSVIPPDPGIATNATTQQILQQLLQTGQTSSLNPTLESLTTGNPAYTAQRSAFDRANAQATSRARLAAAERNAQRGTLGAGGYDAELGGIENESGNRSTQFEAQLVQGELQGQRDRVMQALSLAANSGNAALSRQLQEKLALIDAEIRKSGLNVQSTLGKGQLSLGLLNALLGNQQASNALGFNYAQLGQNGNIATLNAILNGL